MNKMEKMNKKHKDEILKPFNKKFIEKYDRGVIEHSGGLYKKPLNNLVEWGYDEVLDFVCYYSTIQQQLEKIKKIAKKGMSKEMHPEIACEQIVNIFNTGSIDGTIAKGD